MPACVKNPVTGQFLKEPGSGSFVTVDGKVGILNKPIVPILYTWGGINQSKSLTANRCGFLKLSNTNLPVSFKFANTTYISASLPIRNPKLCIDGIKYVPII